MWEQHSWWFVQSWPCSGFDRKGSCEVDDQQKSNRKAYSAAMPGPSLLLVDFQVLNLVYNLNWKLMHFMKLGLLIGCQFFFCFCLLMVILIHQQNRLLKKYRQWRGGEKLQSDGQMPPGWTGSGCRGGKLEGLETQGVALVICFFVFVYLYWERGRETETEIWCFFSFHRSWCRGWTAKGSILRTLQD